MSVRNRHVANSMYPVRTESSPDQIRLSMVESPLLNNFHNSIIERQYES
jgi:hypothetical protein